MDVLSLITLENWLFFIAAVSIFGAFNGFFVVSVIRTKQFSNRPDQGEKDYSIAITIRNIARILGLSKHSYRSSFLLTVMCSYSFGGTSLRSVDISRLLCTVDMFIPHPRTGLIYK